MSNLEVLGRLKELEADQEIDARAALVKKEDDETGHQPSTIEALGAIVSENMRTIQFEVCPSIFSGTDRVIEGTDRLSSIYRHTRH